MQNLVINILQDTTELKALQAQLIRSERLAATGQPAASIAHEINSPQQLGQVFLNLITNAVVAISGVSKPKEGLKRRTGTGGETSIRTILRICYGIIEEHGGTIGAKNSPDGGAVFAIYGDDPYRIRGNCFRCGCSKAGGR